MIKEVTGDILLSGAQAIAHGVAPSDHFDAGLALSLRERWPSLHKDFSHFCHTSHPKSGELWAWKGAGGPQIFNLLTQDAPADKHGRPGRASVENVNQALRELKKEIQKSAIKSLAIPKIATGVGGLDWNHVKPLIEKHLGELEIPVYVYTTYKKDHKAAE